MFCWAATARRDIFWHMTVSRRNHASDRKRVRLFRNGRSQAVRIPKELEFPGEEVVVSRDGDRLILEPVARRSLEEVLAELPDLGEEVGEIEDPAPELMDL
jgi:antitoxin VapB